MYNTTNKSNFVSHLKQLCINCQLIANYDNTSQIDVHFVKKCLFERLSDKWSAACENMNKLDLYKQIKTSFGTEKFLSLNIDRSKNLC